MSNMIPVVDLARRSALFGESAIDDVARVMRGGHYLLGPELDAFETEFAAYTGYPHCVAVGSGTDALRLTMTAMGIGVGDEVIVPAMTAVPTAAAVCVIGATPVIVDVDRYTAAISVDAVRAAITPATKAIVPVHLYGRPAPVCELGEFGIAVIEDAAQAHGARNMSSTGCGAESCGTKSGCRINEASVSRPSSIAAAYSFYPTKNLGGIGDGGAVVCDSAELAEHLRRLRFHGQTELYRHVEIATNSRMSEVESVFLRHALRQLDHHNARRREIMNSYRAAAPNLRWHAEHSQHVYHLAVLRVENRDVFRKEMTTRGIGTGVHYPLSVIEQPAYQKFARAACPEASKWAAECVSLPIGPEFNDNEIERVAQALRDLSSMECAQ